MLTLALGGHTSVNNLLYERDCLAAALAAEKRRSAEFEQLWRRSEQELLQLRAQDRAHQHSVDGPMQCQTDLARPAGTGSTPPTSLPQWWGGDRSQLAAVTLSLGRKCFFFWWGSAPQTPPLSWPGGLEIHNKYIKFIFKTFYQIQVY